MKKELTCGYVEPRLGVGFVSDLNTGEAAHNFVDLYSNNPKLIGTFSENRYSRALGFTSHCFSIDLPFYASWDNSQHLLVGENSLSDLESERQSGNESSYLYFLPGRNSIDKKEYYCAPILTVHELTKEGSYKVGEGVFEGYRSGKLKEIIILSLRKKSCLMTNQHFLRFPT
ncbi:MAG: hypothetical protein H0U49_05400 [Parachlamydiaceae bacterium]|nr:hypothetical protein [Parachlamydiaceae bacterium]